MKISKLYKYPIKSLTPVETESSQATYTNGILDLVLNKKESDEPKGTKVKVN